MKSIIYIGMDVHKKTYSLCALLKETGEIIGETKIPADVSLIIKFIENAKKSVDSDDVQIKTGYEAGCLGYSLYWQLAAKGIECDILAPSTMHRSAKIKVVKNDRRDAKNIATNLANGTYKSVYVPTEEVVEIKEYIRMMHDFKIELSDMYREILDEYLSQFEILSEKIERFKYRLEELSQKETYNEEIGQLRCIKGFDTTAAMTMHAETSDFDRFPTANAFASYCGLTPDEDSSGDSYHRLGITK